MRFRIVGRTACYRRSKLVLGRRFEAAWKMSSEDKAHARNFFDPVCTNEKSAPLSTAFALPSASISLARASARTPKYLSNQSHSAWRDWMYIWVAPNSLVVDALFSVLVSREACKSAKVPCLSARVLESSALFAAESLIMVS